MNKEARFWDKMASRYDETVKSRYEQAYADTVGNTRKYLKKTDRILDFACGTGITAVELAGHVREIYAIDISPKMIEAARSKAEAQNIYNITFKTGEISDSELKPGSFDAVLAFNILHGMKEGESVLRRIRELLKSGGYFISATDCLGEKRSFQTVLYSLASLTGIIPYVRKYSMGQLESAIEKAGFRIIQKQNLYASPPNLFIAAQKE